MGPLSPPVEIAGSLTGAYDGSGDRAREVACEGDGIQSTALAGRTTTSPSPLDASRALASPSGTEGA
jgi:hypothetical protein